MNTLTIVRHAKSCWDDHDLQDWERPLNKRGKRDAPEMGRRLVSAGIQPDRLVSSHAVRAWKTAEIIAEEIGFSKAEVIEEKGLYLASLSELLQVIEQWGEDCEHLMIFGHNPGLTDLVDHYQPGLTVNLPTAGTVTVRFVDGKPELLNHDFPKKGQDD